MKSVMRSGCVKCAWVKSVMWSVCVKCAWVKSVMWSVCEVCRVKSMMWSVIRSLSVCEYVYSSVLASFPGLLDLRFLIACIMGSEVRKVLRCM